ncbi:MAG: methylmalonyl Co-A mutase-associated GTPase MeaB [Nitrospirae bacterium]|nr:methylmalonyl Co-A mutase-associated GTPase MeaB [Nitrospirota bacterium]
MKKLIQELLKGNKGAAARLITFIEDNAKERKEILKALKPHTGNAHIVGITGAPGSGKSTLIDSLIKLLRENKKTVGVIAVDPTSPITGGSILGDRIRMRNHSMDDGVFIRSMATRGEMGGISQSALDAASVLDAAGYDTILIETTGVGQSETAVKDIVHTVVVVITPGLGDDIQMMKAGIMEIADIFVVNKADLKNAEETARSIEDMISLLPQKRKTPSVVLTVASEEKGIAELFKAIEDVQYKMKNAK